MTAAYSQPDSYTEKELSAMTKAQLTAAADSLGVKVTSGSTKAEIVQAILSKEAE